MNLLLSHLALYEMPNSLPKPLKSGHILAKKWKKNCEKSGKNEFIWFKVLDSRSWDFQKDEK